MHYSTKPVWSAALAWSSPLDIPSKKVGSNFLLFTCTCTHSLQKIKLGIALRPEMGKRNILAKEINYFECASFWLSFFHFGWGKSQVTALLFNISVAAFCSILYPTYCFRQNLCCTFIVHSNHYFLPHQNIPHTSPFLGTSAKPRLPRTTEWRRQSTEQSKVQWKTVYSTAGTNDTIGLLSPTQFSLRSHNHGITNANNFLPLALTALIRLLTHSGLYSLKMRDIKQAVKGSFRKYASCQIKRLK